MTKSLWNCLLVAISQISLDINILVTNKCVTFLIDVTFLSSGEE